jgi:hypothetical protein
MRAADIDARCNEIAGLDVFSSIVEEGRIAREVLDAIGRGECDDPAGCARYVTALMAAGESL